MVTFFGEAKKVTRPPGRIPGSSLEIKRKVIQRHMDNGLFPYTKRYLGTLRNHFSTLGVNGINEMVRNFSGGERRGSPGEYAASRDVVDRVASAISYGFRAGISPIMLSPAMSLN